MECRFIVIKLGDAFFCFDQFLRREEVIKELPKPSHTHYYIDLNGAIEEKENEPS